jgi:Acyltransferase
MTMVDVEKEEINLVTWSLVEEIFNALGMAKTGFACRTFGWTLKPIARKVAVLTVPCDHDLRDYGSRVAALNFIHHFVAEIKTRGTETIPPEGPVIVASNHPGAYDSFSIISQIPRPDTKIVVSDIPFLKYLPHVKDHVFYATSEPSSRMNAVRLSLRHLQQGGCLTIFSTGLIDPDPEVWGEAEASRELENWSPSLELFLRKVPNAKLVVTITSGVLDPGWAESRLTHIVKPGIDRRRLAEFGQVISQLLKPGRKSYTPHISFAPPVTLEDLGSAEGEVMKNIILRAKSLLKEHMSYPWY